MGPCHPVLGKQAALYGPQSAAVPEEGWQAFGSIGSTCNVGGVPTLSPHGARVLDYVSRLNLVRPEQCSIAAQVYLGREPSGTSCLPRREPLVERSGPKPRFRKQRVAIGLPPDISGLRGHAGRSFRVDCLVPTCYSSDSRAYKPLGVSTRCIRAATGSLPHSKPSQKLSTGLVLCGAAGAAFAERTRSLH